MTRIPTLVVTVIATFGGALLPAQQSAVAQGSSTLTGVILADDTGLPIPNASIRVFDRLVQGASSDAEGRFEITGITPGSHLVTAVTAGYALATTGQRYPSDTPSLVEFQARAVRSVEIRLTPLGVIAGTILDEQGRPVAAAEVIASRAQTRGECRDCRAITDRDGRYRLTGLSDGRYHVMAIAPVPGDAQRAARSSVAPPTGAITYYPGTAFPRQAATLAIAAGTRVEATFPLVPGEPARIAGTIIDSRGIPVRDYLVMLDALPPQPQSLLPRYIEVGADGSFELKDVPPGEYTLLVRDQERFVLLAQRVAP